ncbi:MAG: hypothetical protein ACFFDW_13545 [Candidatus Thorarchaeota archaeon]
MTFEIEEITLYKSGIGFFTGKCKEKDLIIPVNESDVNDVLKSLSVDGLRSVTFSAAEEKDNIKRKIGISINTDSAFLSFSKNLIGLTVFIEADNNYNGKILGIDFILLDEINDNESGIDVLILQDETKVYHIPISKIKKLKILDPYLLKDLEAYLNLESSTRKIGVTNLTIHSEVDNAAINWVSPVSAWRLSYRIFHDEGSSKTNFTGIAIVDNTTSIDWEKITLRLVTGYPVSFKYNLLSPLYVDRPWVSRDEKGISPIIAQTSHAFRGERRTRSSAPQFSTSMVDSISLEGRSGWDVSRDIIESKTKATSDEIGSTVTYEIINPITIKRSESSLIPLFNKSMKSQLCVVAREDRLDECMDILLFNDNIDLEKGVATIYVDEIFAGEAIIVRGSDYIAFRVNQDIKVIKSTQNDSKLTSISLKKNLMYQKYTETTKIKFNFLNISDKKMPVILEINKLEGYDPKIKPIKETANYVRYKIDLDTGSSDKEFVFERTYSTSVYIRNLSEETVKQLVKDELLDNKDEKTIMEIFAILRKIEEKKKEISEIDNEINWEYRNQERIRENIKMLQEIRQATERQNYIEKLKNSEQLLEKLQRDKKNLKVEIEQMEHKI